MAFRWAIGAALTALFILLVVGNIAGCIDARRRKKGFSFVSILGGLLGVSGFLTLPIKTLQDRFWLPLLIDITIPLLIVGLLTSPTTIDHPKSPATPPPEPSAEPPAHRTPHDNT